MFGHPLELIIVLVLALIVFGPEKLPEMAASAGKFVRELREAVSAAANPEEPPLPDDFSTYYYDSLARSDSPVEVEDMPDPADDGVDFSHTGETDAGEMIGVGEPSGSHSIEPRQGEALTDEDLDPAAFAPVADSSAHEDRDYHP